MSEYEEMGRCCETCSHDLGGGCCRINRQQSRQCHRQARPARAHPTDASAALPPLAQSAVAAVR